MWIAKNKDNTLHIFCEKPTRNSNKTKWAIKNCDFGYRVDADTISMFRHLTWEDEPVMVKIAIPMEWYMANAAHHTQE